MTYTEFIQNIINTRGQWNILNSEYYEIHHIKPKCLGGLPKRPSKTSRHPNIIWLTGQEHFIAHKLLAEENPNNAKLVAAFWRMCHSKNYDYEITAAEYEEAKKLHASNMSKRMSGKNNPSYGKPNNHSLGKHWKLTDETKKRQSIAKLGKKHSYETKLKISKNKKGKPSKNKGKHLSIETRQKLSAAKKLKNSHWKAVFCLELNRVFDSIKFAAQAVRVSASSISSCLAGKTKTASGYHWQYYIIK